MSSCNGNKHGLLIWHMMVGVAFLATLCSIVSRPGYWASVRRAPLVIRTSYQEFFVDGPKREADRKRWLQLEERRYQEWKAQTHR